MTEEYNLSACTMSIEHADFLTLQVKIFMHTLMLSKGFQSIILDANSLLNIKYLNNISQLAWSNICSYIAAAFYCNCHPSWDICRLWCHHKVRLHAVLQRKALVLVLQVRLSLLKQKDN